MSKYEYVRVAECEVCGVVNPDVEYCEDVGKTLCVECYASELMPETRRVRVVERKTEGRRAWKHEDIKFLVENYDVYKLNHLAKLMKRSPLSVQRAMGRIRKGLPVGRARRHVEED